MLKINSKKTIAITVSVSLVSIIAISAFVFSNRAPISDEQVQENSSTEETINYDPPTQQEVAQVDQNKQNIADKLDEETNQVPNQDGSKTQVMPVITYAGVYDSNIEVGGYVDAFEETGTCTATFQTNGTEIKKSVTAVRGAKSMDCPVMILPGTEIKAGSIYTVTLSYDSSKSTGISAAKTIEAR